MEKGEDRRKCEKIVDKNGGFPEIPPRFWEGGWY
jgi:hypothetical protein